MIPSQVPAVRQNDAGFSLCMGLLSLHMENLFIRNGFGCNLAKPRLSAGFQLIRFVFMKLSTSTGHLSTICFQCVYFFSLGNRQSRQRHHIHSCVQGCKWKRGDPVGSPRAGRGGSSPTPPHGPGFTWRLHVSPSSEPPAQLLIRPANNKCGQWLYKLIYLLLESLTFCSKLASQ